jgi:trehalose 6-phosphate phosphatase
VELLPDSLVAVDFDGTLSPIVDDPDAAMPVEGAVDAVRSLAERGVEVAVISGRPTSFLSRHLPDEMTLVGLYGLEVRRDGDLQEHPNSGVWRETMSDVASGARLKGPEGMRVELKSLSITLHYRERPELAEDVHSYAEGVAKQAGLHVRDARKSVELHPPIEEDKGTALSRLAEEHEGVIVYIGDDLGDLTAFDALDRLESAGRRVVRVAVHSDEVPDALEARADVVVDGPAGVVELLEATRV